MRIRIFCFHFRSLVRFENKETKKKICLTLRIVPKINRRELMLINKKFDKIIFIIGLQKKQTKYLMVIIIKPH